MASQSDAPQTGPEPATVRRRRRRVGRYGSASQHKASPYTQARRPPGQKLGAIAINWGDCGVLCGRCPLCCGCRFCFLSRFCRASQSTTSRPRSGPLRLWQAIAIAVEPGPAGWRYRQDPAPAAVILIRRGHNPATGPLDLDLASLDGADSSSSLFLDGFQYLNLLQSIPQVYLYGGFELVYRLHPCNQKRAQQRRSYHFYHDRQCCLIVMQHLQLN